MAGPTGTTVVLLMASPDAAGSAGPIPTPASSVATQGSSNPGVRRTSRIAHWQVAIAAPARFLRHSRCDREFHRGTLTASRPAEPNDAVSPSESGSRTAVRPARQRRGSAVLGWPGPLCVTATTPQRTHQWHDDGAEMRNRASTIRCCAAAKFAETGPGNIAMLARCPCGDPERLAALLQPALQA